jgi:hypothetical protein
LFKIDEFVFSMLPGLEPMTFSLRETLFGNQVVLHLTIPIGAVMNQTTVAELKIAWISTMEIGRGMT